MTGIQGNNNSKSENSANGYKPDYTANIEEKGDISMEEFRANVEMINQLKELMDENVKHIEKGAKEKARKIPPSSVINGNLLSAVFAVVFFMILCVSIFAFYNLFVAIMKKFPSRHTEL